MFRVAALNAEGTGEWTPATKVTTQLDIADIIDVDEIKDKLVEEENNLDHDTKAAIIIIVLVLGGALALAFIITLIVLK